MNIYQTRNEFESANLISDIIIDSINQNPGLILCAATGGSPTETYKHLVKKKDAFSPDKLKILKLDEWGGISMNNPESCEQYLQTHLIEPLQIKKSNYVGFKSNNPQPDLEVGKIKTWIRHNGPIDICILGLGMNGHIALNEPADKLNPECHIAHLSGSSLNHPMVKNMSEAPSYGLTLGMGDILQSKKIIMIIQGEHKKEITRSFLSKKITTNFPASFLWLHANVDCFIEKKADPFH